MTPSAASATGMRAYFSISNNTAGEMLAEIAMRHRDTVLGKTQKTATENLRRLTPSCPSIAKRLAGFLLVAE